jgi:hypothetical protein
LPAGGRRLLFVTCRSRHHFVVDPLVAAVRAGDGEACVLVSSDEDPELAARVRALADAGVPVAYAMDYLPRGEALALVRRYRPIFRRAWRRVARDPELAARLDWHGVSLLPVLRPFLRASAEQSLLTGLLHQEAAFRAFDAVQPEAVVITSDRRYAERAAAVVARARGVPSVLFSGTLVLPRDRTNAFDIGDRVLVIGEHLRRTLMEEEGIADGRISVIGDPRSNAARLVSRPKLRADVYRDFDLAPDRPLLVLVSKYVSLLFSSHPDQGLRHPPALPRRRRRHHGDLHGRHRGHGARVPGGGGPDGGQGLRGRIHAALRERECGGPRGHGGSRRPRRHPADAPGR